MGLRPLMSMGSIQAFEREGTDYIIERLWDGGIREMVFGSRITRRILCHTCPALCCLVTRSV